MRLGPICRMLPTEQRLCANRDFRLIYTRGHSFAHSLAICYVLRRTGDYAAVAPGRRIGFVVSKKQGKAVVRNRIKRRLRETIRARLNEMKEGPFDLILVGRTRTHTAEWADLEAAVEELLRRAGVLTGRSAEQEQGKSDAVSGP